MVVTVIIGVPFCSTMIRGLNCLSHNGHNLDFDCMLLCLIVYKPDYLPLFVVCGCGFGDFIFIGELGRGIIFWTWTHSVSQGPTSLLRLLVAICFCLKVPLDAPPK